MTKNSIGVGSFVTVRKLPEMEVTFIDEKNIAYCRWVDEGREYTGSIDLSLLSLASKPRKGFHVGIA